MYAYKSYYLDMRRRGLSHLAAFALTQNLLGPLDLLHQETFRAWVKAYARSPGQVGVNQKPAAMHR